jgi:hypothetical protein
LILFPSSSLLITRYVFCIGLGSTMYDPCDTL